MAEQKDISKKGFFYRNSLSIVFLLLFLVSLVGQLYTGWHEHNDTLEEYHHQAISLKEYLSTGHFIQATFENWESEFLQIALFVIFTIFLRQQGSSESKANEEIIDPSELIPKENSPWSVKKGGVFLAVYKNSLSIALMLIFIICFWMHLYGSWLDHNEMRMLQGEPGETMRNFLTSSKLWFESFQNWQSEFLSVFAIVFLSIYLRQMGSSQSKAVNDSHAKTGAE